MESVLFTSSLWWSLFQLCPPSSHQLHWPPPPPSLSAMCRSQSIVNLALLDSFSAFLLGVLSVEIDSLGWGLALLRNVRVFAKWAALLASSSSSNIDPPAFSSLALTRWHGNCSTSKEQYEIKCRNVLLAGLLRNAQLVLLTQYLHHPRLISCCPDKSLLIALKWVNYLKIVSFSFAILHFAHILYSYCLRSWPWRQQLTEEIMDECVHFLVNFCSVFCSQIFT